MENTLYKIGIRREEFSKWERRVVLTPSHCKKLSFKFENKLIIKVQPSNVRIYSDEKFSEAGCIIDEDLSDCSLILGVKQVPIDKLISEKIYMFFSHTIKAQTGNMPMLDAIFKKKIQLIDYEKITDEKNNRLVAFGIFAGNAGAIDIMMGLGSFLLNRGIGTPFINISQSYHYKNIDNAKDSIRGVGINIESGGFSHLITPMIFGVTGTGRCAEGSLAILTLLPHEFVEPEELSHLVNEATLHPQKFNKTIYICQFQHHHFVNLKIPNDKPFSKTDYYENPENYTPIFEQTYLQYLSVLINNIYWDDRFPRLITEEYLKEHVAEKKPLRLLAISDVTADFRGSIDFLKKFTTIDFPFFVYDPSTGNIDDDYKTKKEGILYCSIENHPSQFPVDASNFFSSKLLEFMPALIQADIKKNYEDQQLPLPIKKAVISWNGQLTPLFGYIKKLRRDNEILALKGIQTLEDFRSQNIIKDTINLYLEGHLFDTLTLNTVFDILIDKYQFKCTIFKWEVGFGPDKETSCVIKLSNDPKFEAAFEEIKVVLTDKKVKFKFVEDDD